MQSAAVGDYTITAVTETYFRPEPAEFFKDYRNDVLESHRRWIDPQAFDEKGCLALPIKTHVVRSREHTILVDTCLGNNKQRKEGALGHMLTTSFLKDLIAAGVKPEAVDFVMCTHMHADHVGWNTRLENGRWVPTFPKARYLLSRKDWDLLSRRAAERPGGGKVIGDSVKPVVDAGQATLVDGAYRVNETVSIGPLPGHTPGHFGVYLVSRGRTAVFTGDLLHHPVQVAEPAWLTNAGEDPAQSAATLQAFLERHADTGDLIVPAHFPAPGYITRTRDGCRFKTHGE